jgi:hypothetical protein
MRPLCLCILLTLTGCGGGSEDGEIEEVGAWDEFMGALSDEIRGEPGAAALRETRRFSSAGVSFDYPSPLRVRVDRDEYPSWEFGRGEFELELHTPDFTYSSEAYLDNLASVFDSDGSAEGASVPALKVNWCGNEITGAVRHMKIFGDHHRFQGFDLPAGKNGSRFLIFGDMLQKGRWSATAQATFDAVSASIRCETPTVAEQLPLFGDRSDALEFDGDGRR